MNDGRGGSTIEISTRQLRRVALGTGAAIVVLVLLFVGWQQRDRLDLGGIFARGAGDQIDRQTFQAVFLTGGQVYFGRLTTRGEEYFLLSDVYYLSAQSPDSPNPQQPNQLVKRGRELHAQARALERRTDEQDAHSGLWPFADRDDEIDDRAAAQRTERHLSSDAIADEQIEQVLA